MPTVSGRVTTPDGQPAAGVYVYAHSADLRGRPDCHTDTTGTWRLELSAGTWTVRPVGHAAHRVVVADEPVNVDAGRAAATDASGVATSLYLGVDDDGPAIEPLPEPPPDDPPPTRSRRVPRDGGRATDTPIPRRRRAVRHDPPAEPVKTRPARAPRDGGRVRSASTTEES